MCKFKKLSAVVCCASIAILTTGCIGVGQNTIKQGRTRYNEVIRDTNNEQLLLNIVRAGFRETPQFSEVTAVSASSSLATGLMGGLSDIGLAAQAGSISSNPGYTENPIITITPNQGYALISQVSSPINAASINRLLNSNWPITPVLDYIVNDLTPNYLDFGVALNIIRVLWHAGALTIDSSGETQITLKVSADGVLTQSLINRKNGIDSACKADYKISSQISSLWLKLKSVLKQEKGSTIVLNTQTSNPNVYTLQTRSAIGVLNLAIYNYFAFISPDIINSVRTTNAMSPCRSEDSYYVAGDQSPNTQYDTDRFWDTLAEGHISREQAFLTGKKRAYILIERSPSAPKNPYVSVYRKGEWFSIDDDDSISKTNFALLAQIVTIQASPAEFKAPTPGVVIQR